MHIPQLSGINRIELSHGGQDGGDAVGRGRGDGRGPRPWGTGPSWSGVLALRHGVPLTISVL